MRLFRFSSFGHEPEKLPSFPHGLFEFGNAKHGAFQYLQDISGPEVVFPVELGDGHENFLRRDFRIGDIDRLESVIRNHLGVHKVPVVPGIIIKMSPWIGEARETCSVSILRRLAKAMVSSIVWGSPREGPQ